MSYTTSLAREFNQNHNIVRENMNGSFGLRIQLIAAYAWAINYEKK